MFEDGSLTELMAEFSGAQRRYFEKQADKLGYLFVDLTPALQAAGVRGGAKNLTYFRINVHYSPIGHEIVAQAIAEALKSKLD